MSGDRGRLLVAIALVLAAIRFGLFPWLESQSQTRQEAEILTRRLERSESLLRDRATIQRVDREVAARLVAARARFPRFESIEAFRLEAQPRISEVAALNGMTVGVFTWVLDGEVKDANLRFARARIQVTGSLRALASFQGQLQSELPYLFVREVAVAAQGAAYMPDEVFGTLTLTTDLYFRGNPPARAGGG